MALFIPAPNTASVELIYNAGGFILENQFHVRKGSPFSFADLQGVRTVFNSWDAATWKDFRFVTANLIRIKTKALDTDTSPFEDYALSPARAGTKGGALQPLNCTFAIKLASASSGRSARGRIYAPTLSSADMATAYGTVTTTYANNCVAAINTLIANLAAAGYTLCITSKRHNNAWRATAVNYDVTTAVAVDTNVDSQRRRLPGRGRT